MNLFQQQNVDNHTENDTIIGDLEDNDSDGKVTSDDDTIVETETAVGLSPMQNAMLEEI